MKVKLIPEWKKALSMLTVQSNLICGSIIGAYGMMYDQLKESVPAPLMTKIVIGMFVVNIALRLIDQGIRSSNETDA
jgi:F0F1-type ATP synthase assembly protein I